MKHFRIIIPILALFSLSGCNTSPKSAKVTNNPYINAYTSGVISVNAPIRIRLSQEHSDFEQNAVIEKKLFDLSPSVAGETYWITSTTIEFRPKERLKSDQVYKVTFQVSNLIAEAGGDNKTFKFSVATIKPSFITTIDPIALLSDEDRAACELQGEVLTADYMDSQKLEEVLHATIDGQKMEINWEHFQGEKRHMFYVNDITLSDTPANLILHWNGSPVGYDYKHNDTLKIPAKDVFEILDTKVNAQEQYILCTFSEPLARQKFDAYVQFAGNVKPRFNAVANNLYIYLSEVTNQSFKVTIREGLKSKSGNTLKEDYTTTVTFEDAKPTVRLVSKGVLMPSSTNLTLPFQAINLKAVDVRVYHIFENNILQFLQINNLDSQYELHRVGKPVASTTIKLGENKKVNLHQWNTFSLDLAEIMTLEPGAIYEVHISFKRPYSLYKCNSGRTESAEEDEHMTENNDAYEEDEDDGYYYYDWYERDNPCHDSYYNYNRHIRFITQNVIATNLGMIAKQESNNSLMVAVNDLVTTKPLNGVTVTAYNYQQQKITEGRTDNDGIAHLLYNERPYVIVATQDKQKSYLRVDDGVSLSLSSFDVAGVDVKKGINGFIYGERDVWRPGDTIFLSFMLQDVNETLPANHPVVFELYNVQNQLVNRMVHTTGGHGMYAFPSVTTSDAPTGRWEAKVTVGGVTFNKSVRVVTIKPNRLKINTTLDDDVVTGNKNIDGELAVKWLHGADAPGLKADITAQITPKRTTFKDFPDYNFEDVIKQESSPAEKTVTGHLNDIGKMRFSISTDNNNEMPGTLRAALNIRVFEEGGDFSIDNAAVDVMPYASYVGLKAPKGKGYYNRLETDKEQVFDVITVDDKGKPVKRDVEVNIYRTDWSWWWSSSNNSIANYTYRLYQNRVYSTRLTTGSDGKGTFNFSINQPEWGTFLVQVIDKKSGHCTSQRMYIDWWYYGRGDNQSENANMLTFNADKEKYNVGENVLITIPSVAGARALVSLETGSKVLYAFWVECKDQTTDITIATTPDMTPNVYVHITLLQPHTQTKNDLPIRLYGVIPIMVEDPNTRLHPVIKSHDVIHPNESFTIEVSEQDNKEMSYTIAIVDDGLLDLTHFKTPNPWNHFFQRQALGIRTWDVYNFVMGAYGGKIEQIFAIGGDLAETASQSQSDTKANRFKPVVKYAGPFTLKAGEKAKHSFTINDYVGSVRTMVIAGAKQAYGVAEKTMPVRSPLMVQATLPRVLGPAETVSLPVTIFAMEDHVQKVKVELQANDIFEVLGESSKNITFSKPGDDIVYFKVRTKERIGYGKVKITAASGNEKAESITEIEVRTSNPAMVVSEEKVILENQSATLSVTLPGMEGTNTAELEVSSIPPLNLGGRLNYLLEYPHGCLEQTTSGAFPQLYLPDVVDLSDAKKKQAEDNVKSVINRLKLFFIYGHFTYWPGGIYSCDWTNNYVGHFMVEAEQKGYNIPEAIKTSWMEAQQKAAREWRPKENTRYLVAQSDLIQAYRLYVLALDKKPELGAMNRLKEGQSLSQQAKWMLAGAYLLAGQPETARNIIHNLPLSVSAYTGASETYGSDFRDEAIILEILTLLDDKENAFILAKRISEALNSRNWMSTQTTAYCLLSLSKYAASITGKMDFTYTGKDKKTVPVKSKKAAWSADFGAQTGTQTSVKIENRSAAVIFARLSAKGLPAAGKEEATEHNLRLNVRYFDIHGNPISVQNLKQGTDFEARVEIINPGLRGYYTNMALTQIFPSGWEITENRLTDEQKRNGVTYMDIRDDRVLAYFDLSDSLTIRVKLHAAYKGTFYLPAVACEAMYDHTISANTTGQWVRVE